MSELILLARIRDERTLAAGNRGYSSAVVGSGGS
jgi:hypothetical protein